MTILYVVRSLSVAAFMAILVTLMLLPDTSAVASRGERWQRPAYDQRIKVLPHGARTLHSRHGDHYYDRGIFYRRYDSGYRVVRPAAGLIISTLPVGYVSVRFGDDLYARYNDVYYRPVARGYVVVEPPPSAPPAPQPDITATPANALGVVDVTVEVLNVRSGPSRLHPVVNHVAAGDRLPVLATAPDWYYVRLPDGAFGWVWIDFVRGSVISPR